MLWSTWLVLLVLVATDAAATCGKDDLAAAFPPEVAVEDGILDKWPTDKLTVAFEIYNQGVKFHTSQSCRALGCYMAAIRHYGAFPEAFQNAGILISGGCRDDEGDELYVLPNHDELATYYHLQSIKHAKNAEFAATGWGNYAGHKLKMGSFKDNDEIRHTANQMRLQLESIHPVSTPETPWPKTVHFSLALLYNELGESELYHHCLQDLLRTEPNDALAIMNVGNFYFNALDFAQAAHWYGKSLEQSSTKDDASLRVLVLNNQGQSFRELGDYESSRRALTEALLLAWVSPAQAAQIVADNREIKPEYFRSLCLNASLTQGNEEHISCEKQLHTASNLLAVHTLSGYWRDFEMLESLAESGIITVYTNPLLLDDRNTPVVDPYTFSLHRYAAPRSGIATHSVACWYSDNFPEGSFPLEGEEIGSRVLKVGYLSGDWRNHPMGRLTLDLVTTHNFSRVHSQSLSYGRDDKSSVRRAVQLLSPSFVDLFSSNNDEDAHRQVLERRLDVVVDLVGHTYKGRLSIANRRPAPVVINYLGYPGTMGCGGYDYTMLSAQIAPPETAHLHYAESLIYLPHNYQTNSLPLEASPCLEQRPSQCRDRLLDHRISSSGTTTNRTGALSSLEIDEFVSVFSPEHPLLCSFNSHKKFEPLAFLAWMNVMVANPRAVLLLLEPEIGARERIERLAAYHGVPKHRLSFVKHTSWEQHLRRLSACDLVLDTFVYGAHTTSSDALWMWVPVLSLESWNADAMPSRVAASVSGSVLEGGEETESVERLSTTVRSVREYEVFASRFVASEPIMMGIRGELARRSMTSTAFDQVVLERCIERAYQAVHELRRMSKVRVLPDYSSTGLEPGAVLRRDRPLPYHLVVGERPIPPASSLVDKAQRRLATVMSQSEEVPSEADAAVAGRLLRVTPPISALHVALESVVERASYERTRDGTLVETLEATSQHLLTGDLIDSAVAQRLSARLAVHPSHYYTLLETLARSMEAADQCERKQHVFTSLGTAAFREVDGWSYSDLDLTPETISRLRSAFPSLANSALTLVTTRRPLGSLPRGLREHVAVALNNYAACLDSVLQRPMEALQVMLSALGLHHTPERLLNVGLVSQSYDVAAGFTFASQTIAEQQRGRHREWLSSVQERGMSSRQEREDLAAVARLRASTIHSGGGNSGPLTVAIYCYEYGRAYWGQWGPSSKGGMGGSEEAVLYLSQQLGLLGHRVVVYADPPDEDYARDTPEGVAWRHHSWYDQDTSFDLFIAWRYGMSLHIGRNSRKAFLWLQDLVGRDSLPPPASVRMQHIMVLGEFHQNVIADHLRALSWGEDAVKDIPRIVANAAVDEKMLRFMEGSNDNDRFVYGSNPTRGLEQILLVWPRIRSALAEHGRVASLHIYYGFPDKVVAQLRAQMGAAVFEAFYERVTSLLQQDGVIYYGSVGHETLLTAYAHAGFLLYPTAFPETGCITVQKAMSCGAIPLTSRYSTSVLPFLTAGFDLGPVNALIPGMNYTEWMEREWVPAVIEAAIIEKGELSKHREAMKRTIREEYTWKRSAETLLSLM